MRKHWVVMDVSSIIQQGFLGQQVPPRGAARRELRLGMPEGVEAPQPDRGGNAPVYMRFDELGREFAHDDMIMFRDCTVNIFFNPQMAEDYVDGLLQQFPNRKYVLYESRSLLETIASPVQKKAWNNNGELL